MWIIGCDYHPRFQQIAFVNTEGGECGGRRLEHREAAEQFYRSLQGQEVRVGMEASGHARWFERLLAELGFELWVGDPAKIRAAEPRKQKTDERDLRQLVLHRHRLVQMRTRVKNQLRAVALNEGLGPRPGLWSRKGQQQFRDLELPRWSERRRADNLELLSDLRQRTTPLDAAV